MSTSGKNFTDENMKMLLQSIEINDEEALDWAVHAYNATIDRDGHSPMKLVFGVQTDFASLLDDPSST